MILGCVSVNEASFFAFDLYEDSSRIILNIILKLISSEATIIKVLAATGYYTPHP
jgi:hypothetical protein